MRMPVWPLAATLAVQTLATMALYSLPAVAPAVAHDIGVNGALVGGFVATAYGVGIISALLSPALIRRYGGVRATQVVLLAALGMQVIAGTAHGVAALAVSAVVLGLAYGAAAPASTHLLAPKTPQSVFNMIMSLRQIGVPLGGVLAALILPPLVGTLGWRGALLAETVPVLALILLMEIPRKAWDDELDRNRYRLRQTLTRPFALLADKRIRRLSASTFIFSGLQLCFVSFMTVQLTTVAHMDLVTAGRILALYQIAGSVSRPIWGWVADRFLTPSHTLAVHGAGMAAAAALTGQFGPTWPGWMVAMVVLLAGCTAGGYTGVAYAEYAHLGGARRTEATGLGTALMFSGGMLMPTAFSAAITARGDYALTYGAAALLALAGGVLLAIGTGRWGQKRNEN
jgi:MFS family permease